MRSKYLAGLARKHGWKTGAEIGVWYGKTFFHLLDNVPDLVLFGVDAWVPLDEKYTHHRNVTENRSEVMIKTLEYGCRAHILSLPSIEASKKFVDGALDFVFIDGDHSIDGVKADISAWYPKVKVGGFLTGHDWDWESVRIGVTELLPDVKAGREDNDYVWTWRKQ